MPLSCSICWAMSRPVIPLLSGISEYFLNLFLNRHWTIMLTSIIPMKRIQYNPIISCSYVFLFVCTCLRQLGCKKYTVLSQADAKDKFLARIAYKGYKFITRSQGKVPAR